MDLAERAILLFNKIQALTKFNKMSPVYAFWKLSVTASLKLHYCQTSDQRLKEEQRKLHGNNPNWQYSISDVKQASSINDYFCKEIFLDINQPTKSINSRHMLKLHRKPFGVAIISWCKTSNSIENSTRNNQMTTFNKETQRAENMMDEEVLCLLLLFLFELVTIQNLEILSQIFFELILQN